MNITLTLTPSPRTAQWDPCTCFKCNLVTQRTKITADHRNTTAGATTSASKQNTQDIIGYKQLNATKCFPGYDMERTRIKVMMMRVDVVDDYDVPVFAKDKKEYFYLAPLNCTCFYVVI